MAKSDTTSHESSSGVDALVDQLKQDGVEAGREEAERIVREARAEADRILKRADDEADAALEKGRQALELERAAVEDGLRQASRDLLLSLQTDLGKRLEARITALCEDATRDPEFLKALLLAAVGREVPRHERLDVAVTVLGEAHGGATEDDAASAWLAGELSELLRDGVQLHVRPGEAPGLHIQLVERDARVDVTPQALAELLWQRMIPRFRHLLDFGD